MAKKLKTKLKIVCAWCGKDMGEKDSKGIEGTSHSICHECDEEMLKEGIGGNSERGQDSKEGN